MYSKQKMLMDKIPTLTKIYNFGSQTIELNNYLCTQIK